ncbi:hypothetical protein C9890_0122 [Perkinsus sp. BL_2016]|nr:hypothetical protein C9890_0122 [Perkinsus sp. BL_2016]
MSTKPDATVTPERSTKRFRNESSPFRAATFSVSDESRPCWEWKSSTGKWTEFSPIKNQALESSFCSEASVTLPGSDKYIVDLRRFMQVNMETGNERCVRRRVIPGTRPTNDDDESTQVGRRRFDGRQVFLNRIPDISEKCQSVSFRDIVTPASEIEGILLSSYGTDVEWLLSHFKAGTPITVIDQPTGDTEQTSFVPLGSYWPMFQVVHPRFEKGGLFESGTMHCKLIVIKWKNNQGLRIVVSSANLVRFDWESITQVCWIVDIDLSTPLPSVPGGFGGYLHEFVSALVQGQELVTDWLSILDNSRAAISTQVPVNVFLVGSVPGTFSGDRLTKFGQIRLRDVLRSNNISNDQSVQFQVSSIGMLQKPFLSSFMESTCSNNSFHLVWPEYQKAMSLPGKDHMMLYEKNERTAAPLMTPLVPLDSRAGILNHSKVLVGRSKEDDSQLSFVYIGSHNMSMSAWGRLVFDNKSLQIASFELGIVIVRPLQDMHLELPFKLRPSPTPLQSRPWMLDAYLRRLSAGTEDLSNKERASITVNNSETMSLADILSLKSRRGGRPIFVLFRDTEDTESELVKEFMNISWLNRDGIDIFQIRCGSDYSNHLASHFYIKSFPSIVVLQGGSSLSNNCEVLERLDGVELVLGSDVEQIISRASQVSTVASDEEEILIRNGIVVEQPSLNGAISFVKERGFSLLCLDVDGTIVESNQSSVLLSATADFLSQLDSNSVKVALVTNQGGVGLRHWMTTNAFGDPASLPTQDEVEKRISAIAEKIKSVFSGDLKVFMAFRYQSKGGEGKQPRWGPVPFKSKDDPRWLQDWRKPGPGMINAAMKWAGMSLFNKAKVLMVGDMDADEGAARAAGVSFKRAPEFFTAPV